MKKILVYLNENLENKLLGYLYVENIRGSEIYSFEYTDFAIKNKLTNIIQDEEISPVPGRQYKVNSKTIYRFVEDCCPDRWGRNLIKRNEINKAKEDHRTPRQLLESDYLLGVSDFSRMGSLRFKLEEDGDFLDNSVKVVPPLVFLSKLENASYDSDLIDKNIELLLSPGSSLGGSRPKATIKDSNGELYLAKFPSKTDEYDISGYEMVANELARKIGLNVPETKLVKLSNHGQTFLVKRFDREKEQRFFYASFMTLLNANDGENNDYSYLDIVNKIREMSSRPKEDLLELFKRVALNIIIHNNDDHLRNHGMIYHNKKWFLSPVFDINPTFNTTHLSLNIDLFNNEYSLKTLIETSLFYLISENDAIEIVNNIIRIVKNNFLILAEKFHLPNNINKLFFENFSFDIN